MDKKIILITGANGFIGSTLVSYFNSKGYKIKAFCHHIPNIKITGVDYYNYSLEDEKIDFHFAGIDIMIHTAYSFQKSHINYNGTKLLLEKIASLPVKNIFLSTFSSSENVYSQYGIEKFRIEKLFNINSDCVVRPGLVVGNGGLYKKMNDYILKASLIPLLKKGNQPIQPIYIYDLADGIEKIIVNNISGIIYIAPSKSIEYKRMFDVIFRKNNRIPKFVYLPSAIFLFAIKVIKIFNKSGITEDNYYGLKSMKYIDTTSDLNKLGIVIKPFEEILELL